MIRCVSLLLALMTATCASVPGGQATPVSVFRTPEAVPCPYSPSEEVAVLVAIPIEDTLAQNERAREALGAEGAARRYDAVLRDGQFDAITPPPSASGSTSTP